LMMFPSLETCRAVLTARTARTSLVNKQQEDVQ
jgi:hypothetical protein